MTFDEIVNEVADRMNLSAPSALDRIGRSVNERYKQLCSSVGLQTSIRSTTPVTSATAIGSRNVTFGSATTKVQKIITVFDATVTPAAGTFTERSVEYLRNQSDSGDQSREYGILAMGAFTVTIFLGGVPTTVRTLSADVELNKATLAGTDVPAFSEAFHDVLILYAMAVELDKLEKKDAAVDKKKESEWRASELRMYIAKSAYLDIIAGGRGTARLGQPLVV